MRKLTALLAAAVFALSFSVQAADISITATDVIPSSAAQTATYTAGAAITAGQVVYYDSTTSTLKLADANLSAAASVVKGIAINNAGSGQPVHIVIYDPNLTIGGSRTVGDVYILSGTAGGVAPVADLASGMYCTVIGVVTTTTKICFGTDMRAGAAKS